MDSHADDCDAGRPGSKRHWQYSLFSLLVVTTIVSICLALFVNAPRLVTAALAAGVVQAAVLLSADWLIRSRRGRTLSLVTACLWLLFGTVFLFAGWQLISEENADSQSLMPAMVCTAGGLLCWYFAWRRWR